MRGHARLTDGEDEIELHAARRLRHGEDDTAARRTDTSNTVSYTAPLHWDAPQCTDAEHCEDQNPNRHVHGLAEFAHNGAISVEQSANRHCVNISDSALDRPGDEKLIELTFN